MKPQSGVFEAPAEGGVIFQYTNDLELPVTTEYVEFTAPTVCCLTATVDGVLIKKAWAGAGGCHSWWTAAGGRFLRFPLKPGQTLTIELDGRGAIRLDWYD